MSAFAAFLEEDGGPADDALAARLGGALAPAGGQACARGDGSFHCRTAAAPVYWQPEIAAAPGYLLAGMIRLDARSEIEAMLPGDAARSDAALLLDAIRRWGADALDRVSGDFSFAAWDVAQRRLIAATDQFGSRPLYYARAGGRLLISDSLDALRAIHGVGSELDENFLADMICAGFPLDPASTVYARIRVLPPGHRLTWHDGTLRIDAYWRPPPRGPLLLYRRDEEYAEHFRELFLRAVADRLPAEAPIGVAMSGGLDSTAVAAAARHILGGEGAARITAYTAIMRDFEEEEGRFARMVTDRLGIEAKFLLVEDYSHRPIPREHARLMPQPGNIPQLSPGYEAALDVARGGGVLLGGIGGDALLAPYDADIGAVVRAEGWAAPRTIGHHLLRFGRLPRLGARRLARRILHRNPPVTIPPWIDLNFAGRTGVTERFRAHMRRPARTASSLNDAFWTRIIAMGASSISGLTMESGHPFFDVRLVDLAVRLPEAQLRGKHILRAAMAPMLPREVVERPKTSLGLASLSARRNPAIQARHRALMEEAAGFGNFFDLEQLRAAIAAPQARTVFALGRAEAIIYWLSRRADLEA